MAKAIKVTSTGLKRLIGLSSESWLSSYTDDWLVKQRNPRIDPGWFHPSELSTPCDRRLAFSFLGMPKTEADASPELMRIFHNGDMVHRRWQAYFRSMNLLVGREVAFENKEPPIRGKADAVIRHPVSIEHSVVEIKSINSNGFGKLTEPREDHFNQVNTYMGCLQIPTGHVLYENKDNQTVKIFPVRFDATRFEMQNFRLLKILRKIYKDEVPVPYVNDGCTSCPYFKACYDAGNSVAGLAERWRN